MKGIFGRIPRAVHAGKPFFRRLFPSFGRRIVREGSISRCASEVLEKLGKLASGQTNPVTR